MIGTFMVPMFKEEVALYTIGTLRVAHWRPCGGVSGGEGEETVGGGWDAGAMRGRGMRRDAAAVKPVESDCIAALGSSSSFVANRIGYREREEMLLQNT
jgi:hypothetical protein